MSVEPLRPLLSYEPSIGRKTVSDLASRLLGWRVDPRKKAQLQRHKILCSQHEREIVKRVSRSITTPELIDQVAQHVSTALNPGADIITNLCQVWKNPPMRRIDGATEMELEAFNKLVTECGIDNMAPEWNRLAYFVGPVVVLPVMRGKALRLDAMLPFATDLILDPDDPMGEPVGAAFDLGDWVDDKDPRMLVVDRESWRYYRVTKSTGKVTEVTDKRIDHGLGRFPGAILDFFSPMDVADRYVCDRHKRITDGSLDVGRIYATMCFVRRTQNKKLLAFFGNVESLADGQNLGDPENPLMAFSQDPGSISAETLDFDTDPSNFLKEIRFIVEHMAESTGVPVSMESGGVAHLAVNYDMNFDQAALTELRNAQIWHARRFEQRLWTIAVEVARRGRHPLVMDLPDMETVDAGFSAEFNRISRKFADPTQEMLWWDWMLKHGAASVLDILRKDHPNYNDAQLWEIIDRNMENNSRWYDEVTKRNMSVSLDGSVVTAAEANGSMGTPVRDGKAPPPKPAVPPK